MTSTKPHPLAFGALLLGNAALAFGPWLVRLADTGPVAAGFWRLFLALPLLWLTGLAVRQRPHWPALPVTALIAAAAILYALDLAAWNAGIRLTRLGNATLFGNCGSFVLAAWGLWLARRRPTVTQGSALLLAGGGAALLMSGSYELDPRYLTGDALTLLAGLLYGGYLIFMERARGSLRPVPALLLATLFATLPLLVIALAAGERLWPGDWAPLLILAVSSQLVGQGLLIYAIGTLPALVVGLALLTQPAIAAFIGWAAYGERLSMSDWAGAAAIAAALVLVRLPQQGLRAAAPEPT